MPVFEDSNFNFHILPNITSLIKFSTQGYTYFWLITAGGLGLASISIHYARRGCQYLIERIRDDKPAGSDSGDQ